MLIRCDAYNTYTNDTYDAYTHILIYIYIYIYRHVFCPSEDSSMWLGLTIEFTYANT